MIDNRTKLLVSTVRKFLRREAVKNVQRILEKTHKADIAAMLEALQKEERLPIFRAISSNTERAEILRYLSPDVQTEVLTSFEKNEAKQIISQMPSNEAADILGRIPEEFAHEILDSMGKDSEEVVDLMRYPEDSAGGLMNVDVLSLDENLSVTEAVKEIQRSRDESKVSFYVYVVNDTNQLVGVLSLKQLLLNQPNVPLKEIMSTDVISVSVDTSQDEVAKIIERYDFLYLPVVDTGNKLVGVISVDDVIDVIRAEAEEDLLGMGRAGFGGDTMWENIRSRLPWLFLTFWGGILCYGLVLIAPVNSNFSAWWGLAGFIPLVLGLGTTAGHQALTVAVGEVLSGRMDRSSFVHHLWEEAKLGSLFGLVFGVLMFTISHLFFNLGVNGNVVALTLLLVVALAVLLGTITPVALKKMNIDPALVSVPLFTVLEDVIAVLIYFQLASYFVQ